MSEEAAAFAGRNELDDPFPIVLDDEPAAKGALQQHDTAPNSAPAVSDDPPSTTGGPPAGNADNASDDDADPVVAALHAVDSRHFLQTLIGMAARDMQNGDGDAASLGLVLARLGQALAEGQDEEDTLQDLVDGLERRRLADAQLRAVTPFVGLFVARVVAAPYRHDPTLGTAATERLVHAAEEVVGAGLQAGGVRAWSRLPDIAATIAERAAKRRLPVADLAEALPRLAMRFGLGPRAPVMRIISKSDHPRGDLARGEAAEKPRRMLISGPVEIVILDR